MVTNPIRHGFSALVLVLGLMMTAGCAGRGILYTQVVRPYTRDYSCTPTGVKSCRVNEHTLREPFSGADVSVSVTTRVLVDAAHAAGMTHFYYADLETLSILNGIYERQTVILHGD